MHTTSQQPLTALGSSQRWNASGGAAVDFVGVGRRCGAAAVSAAQAEALSPSPVVVVEEVAAEVVAEVVAASVAARSLQVMRTMESAKVTVMSSCCSPGLTPVGGAGTRAR